jgi:hypothetical protein
MVLSLVEGRSDVAGMLLTPRQPTRAVRRLTCARPMTMRTAPSGLSGGVLAVGSALVTVTLMLRGRRFRAEQAGS